MGKRQSVNTYLVRKVGVRRAVMVETFVMLWSTFAAAEGRDPATIDELADAIGRNRSTLFRWQSDFREAFDHLGWSTPRDLLDYAASVKPVNVRQVGGFVMPEGV